MQPTTSMEFTTSQGTRVRAVLTPIQGRPGVQFEFLDGRMASGRFWVSDLLRRSDYAPLPAQRRGLSLGPDMSLPADEADRLIEFAGGLI